MFPWEFSDWCFKQVSFVLLYCTNYGTLVAIKNFGQESQVLQPNSKGSQRKFKSCIIFISKISYYDHTLRIFSLILLTSEYKQIDIQWVPG